MQKKRLQVLIIQHCLSNLKVMITYNSTMHPSCFLCACCCGVPISWEKTTEKTQLVVIVTLMEVKVKVLVYSLVLALAVIRTTLQA